jgi:radical SAM-linked protein
VEQPDRAVFHYRASYAKLDPVKYLSHLDLARTLPRAFRRAGVPLAYSTGFHPMPLLSYGPALGVGAVGEDEWLDFDSPVALEPEEFLGRINAALPDGLRFSAARRLASRAPALTKVINRAEYAVRLDTPILASAARRLAAVRDDLLGLDALAVHRHLVEEFFACESVTVERIRKGKGKSIDVRRFAKAFALDGSNGDSELRIVLEVNNSGTARPSEVLGRIYRLDETEAQALAGFVRRRRVFVWRDGNEETPFDVVEGEREVNGRNEGG